MSLEGDSLFTQLIDHEHVEVRKSTVSALVELNLLVEPEEFDTIMQKFNQSQRRLVQIYIDKAMAKLTNT